MADVEFGTEFPELNLLTLEEATIDGEAVERVRNCILELGT